MAERQLARLRGRLRLSTSNKTKLAGLCRKYTNMSEQEINFILKKTDAIDELAEVFDCDVFIDVPLKSSTASIVVYHVLPVTKQSLYKKSPVGQPALKMNEPGVWKVSRSGCTLKGYKAFTQENVFIKQNIHAIQYGEKVLGTYILESAFHEVQDAEEEKNDYMTMTAKLNNYIDDAIYFFDVSGKLIFQNDKADSFSSNLSDEGVHYNHFFVDQLPYSDLF